MYILKEYFCQGENSPFFFVSDARLVKSLTFSFTLFFLLVFRRDIKRREGLGCWRKLDDVHDLLDDEAGGTDECHDLLDGGN
jgi:hypothetical protein